MLLCTAALYAMESNAQRCKHLLVASPLLLLPLSWVRATPDRPFMSS